MPSRADAPSLVHDDRVVPAVADLQVLETVVRGRRQVRPIPPQVEVVHPVGTVVEAEGERIRSVAAVEPVAPAAALQRVAAAPVRKQVPARSALEHVRPGAAEYRVVATSRAHDASLRPCGDDVGAGAAEVRLPARVEQRHDDVGVAGGQVRPRRRDAAVLQQREVRFRHTSPGGEDELLPDRFQRVVEAAGARHAGRAAVLPGDGDRAVRFERREEEEGEEDEDVLVRPEEPVLERHHLPPARQARRVRRAARRARDRRAAPPRPRSRARQGSHPSRRPQRRTSPRLRLRSGSSPAGRGRRRPPSRGGDPAASKAMRHIASSPIAFVPVRPRSKPFGVPATSSPRHVEPPCGRPSRRPSAPRPRARPERRGGGIRPSRTGSARRRRSRPRAAPRSRGRFGPAPPARPRDAPETRAAQCGGLGHPRAPSFRRRTLTEGRPALNRARPRRELTRAPPAPINPLSDSGPRETRPDHACRRRPLTEDPGCPVAVISPARASLSATA